MRVKMSIQPPPASTASALGPCPTITQIVGRPGTGSLPSTIAPPDHPPQLLENSLPSNDWKTLCQLRNKWNIFCIREGQGSEWRRMGSAFQTQWVSNLHCPYGY